MEKIPSQIVFSPQKNAENNFKSINGLMKKFLDTTTKVLPHTTNNRS